MRLAQTVCLGALLTLAAGGFLIQTQVTPAVKKKSSTKQKARRGKGKAVPSWLATQQTPTPERYRQIQQALMEKGYLTGTATGVWGAESVEALKRFQRDQNLEPTGKLTSLSLIALGLGPRRDLNSHEGQPADAGARTKK